VLPLLTGGQVVRAVREGRLRTCHQKPATNRQLVLLSQFTVALSRLSIMTGWPLHARPRPVASRAWKLFQDGSRLCSRKTFRPDHCALRSHAGRMINARNGRRSVGVVSRSTLVLPLCNRPRLASLPHTEDTQMLRKYDFASPRTDKNKGGFRTSQLRPKILLLNPSNLL
jgi:hypothetical protein